MSSNTSAAGRTPAHRNTPKENDTMATTPTTPAKKTRKQTPEGVQQRQAKAEAKRILVERHHDEYREIAEGLAREGNFTILWEPTDEEKAAARTAKAQEKAQAELAKLREKYGDTVDLSALLGTPDQAGEREDAPQS
jgi:hypothetical protein